MCCGAAGFGHTYAPTKSTGLHASRVGLQAGPVSRGFPREVSLGRPGSKDSGEAFDGGILQALPRYTVRLAL